MVDITLINYDKIIQSKHFDAWKIWAASTSCMFTMRRKREVYVYIPIPTLYRLLLGLPSVPIDTIMFRQTFIVGLMLWPSLISEVLERPHIN